MLDKSFRQRLLSIKEAAVYLGRTENALRKIYWDGKIPVVRSDRRIFIDVKDLEKYIEKHKERRMF